MKKLSLLLVSVALFSFISLNSCKQTPKEAEEETKIRHISCVLNGRRKSAGGYKWVKEII